MFEELTKDELIVVHAWLGSREMRDLPSLETANAVSKLYRAVGNVIAVKSAEEEQRYEQ